VSAESLVTQLKSGLDAPICLTWELTYACNLACVHCLSSSGRRDPRELTTAEAKAVLDELRDLQVFYINIGGGEPMIRRDFFEIVDHAIANGIGVKFSTNGAFIDAEAAARLTAMDYLDVQISLDGTDATVNDAVRGDGSFDTAIRAMEHLAEAGFVERNGPFKISVVVTRYNVDQLDDFKALADHFGAQLRVTRLRPSGRGADSWHDLHPINAQQRQIYEWLLAHGDDVLTGDSFFHLNALGDPLPGLNMCGAGRVVCLIDPIGDVYACPFVIHDEFKAGSVRDAGGFTDERPVPRTTSATIRRGVCKLRQLRRLPGRLHGRQVLRRVAARRPRPGMRERARRARHRSQQCTPTGDGPQQARPAADSRHGWLNASRPSTRRRRTTRPDGRHRW
jgi:mycofactocin biosynthetic radical S-adenosylmethionine protein MftC